MNCDLQSKDNVYANSLQNVTNIYGLKQLINDLTQITPLTNTLIYLIFSNQPDNSFGDVYSKNFNSYCFKRNELDKS